MTFNEQARTESGKCGRGFNAGLMKRQNFYGSFSELRFFDRFGNAARRAPSPASSFNRPPRVSRVTVVATSPRQQAPDGFLASHAHRPCLTIVAIFCGSARRPFCSDSSSLLLLFHNGSRLVASP